MARFFITRPVFAMAISVAILLAGTIAALTLPIAQYPPISLPSVNVTASYLGADAATVEQSVTTPIEEQVNGAQGMLWMRTLAGNDGTSRTTVNFALGVNPDIAAVLVQNRVAQASGQLPDAVLSAGITTTKANPDVLMFIALYSPKGTYDATFLSNYAAINVIDALKRVPGVGDVISAASPYAMRIWLRPDEMAARELTPSDVIAAVSEQNVQAPAGQVGGYPSPPGQSFQYTVSVTGRLTTPEEFGAIVVRSLPDGSIIRVRDVARVELQNQINTTIPFYQGKPAVTVAIYQTPEANALATAQAVRAQMQQLSAAFPADVAHDVVVDRTAFVSASLVEVVKTLAAAIALVLLVVFLFLHSARATLVPMLAIPISLVGTFAAFSALGFSINTLTLFGLVLAIGIVVDDAIVVVEAVEHHMSASGLSPRDATLRAMEEVQGPVVAIALVLASVFVPVAFLGGIVGQLYRQFALTITVSVLLSAFVALSLTPALCALVLRPPGARRGVLDRFFGAFDRAFARVTNGYGRMVRVTLRHALVTLLVLAGLWVAAGAVARALPTSFVPPEDLGYLFASVKLPPAAALQRTVDAAVLAQRVAARIPGVRVAIATAGTNLLVNATQSDSAMIVVALDDWGRRTTPALSIDAIRARLQRDLAAALPDAAVVALAPPPLPGLGRTGGFAYELEDRGGHSMEGLATVANELVAAAGKRPELTGVYSTFDPTTPAYRVDVDRDKVKQLEVAVNDVFNALQVFLGGFQVNDFSAFGRDYKVVLQADAPFRDNVADLGLFYVRGAGNALVPLDTVTRAVPTGAPQTVQHYNVYRSVEIGGQAASGYSSGQALAAMEALSSSLPAGYGFEWSGLSYVEQQSAGQTPIVLGFALAFAFLVLAALYESWSTPFAVLLAAPIGVLGAYLAQLVRGLQNDVYAQIGLVLLVGLAAKNAILIVEFARDRRRAGESIDQAALDAGRVRLRPILMTSLAFLFGVVPLVTATGAGAGARHSVGTAVFGGMLLATSLGVFFVPALYAVITRVSERLRAPRRPPTQVPPAPVPPIGRGAPGRAPG